MTTFTLYPTGMTCSSCVGRAEAALTGVHGVTAASVNFANGAATIEADKSAQSGLISALETAGYPAAVEHVRFDIENLSCASCVARLEQALAAETGVTQAVVNLATGTADLSYLKGVTDPAKLTAAAKKAGYPATDSTPDKDATDHIQQLGRQTLVAGILTLPVFVVEMGGHLYPPLHHALMQVFGSQTLWIAQFILTTLVLVLPGKVFFQKGLPALLRGAPDMNALVAMGAGAAWAFSTVATFAPAILPPGTAAVYFEAAAVIVTLILLGRWLEARAKGRTGQAIRALVDLQPREAEVQRGDQWLTLPLDQITVGDTLRLPPGARVATDGTVIQGTSYVDESMVSGEPVPVLKAAGDTVIGGTINSTGALLYQATSVGADTMLAQIVTMVQSAQAAKLPVQDLVNRVTAVFVPIVMAIAAAALGIWLLFGPAPTLGMALVVAVSVLIVACPCAMGLATPTSIMVGTGRAAQLGVLFRKGQALQQLEQVETIAFDKTGTVTKGRPTVVSIQSFGMPRDQMVTRAAAVEAQSEHPIARAILDAAGGADWPDVSGFEATAGQGAQAMVGGATVAIGSASFMTALGVPTAAQAAEIAAIRARAETLVCVAVDQKLVGLIGVSDPVKPEAAAVISALHRAGLRTALITGDNVETARAIATPLGIDTVIADVLPAGKVAALKGLGRVAFVGDGINDAPALAAADVGIAIGTGTDIAIESADVVLMSGDLAGVVNAVTVSKRVMRNIRQNLFWAFAYNAALIPVAAGLLYPFTGLLMSPMLAAGAMALSSIFVLTNALRLQYLAPAAIQEGST